MRVPKKVADRLAKQVRKFQGVLKEAQSRDVSESDTVTIITDMLATIFGFDKYTEVTSEQAIRGTYCDLAVKIDDSIKYLVEVKAIGLTLKDNHLRQAVNYGANQGVPWVVLTNGVEWEVYRVKFERPIAHELIYSMNFLDLNPKRLEDSERLFILCKEGLSKAAIEEFHEHIQTVNRFVVAAVIRSDPVVRVIRREMKRLAPGAKITLEEIENLLPDALKRDVLEGETAKQAAHRVERAASQRLKRSTGKATK